MVKTLMPSAPKAGTEAALTNVAPALATCGKGMWRRSGTTAAPMDKFMKAWALSSMARAIRQKLLYSSISEHGHVSTGPAYSSGPAP